MKRKNSWIRIILWMLIIGIFLFSVVKLFFIYQEYKKGTDTYEELQEYVVNPQDEEETTEQKPNESESQEESPWLQIDFEGLKKQNEDVIGWIHMPALNISYPMVQGTDNSYYLTHLFSGENNSSGSIFVDSHNKADFTDQNTIVYGHNMKNGSMFGTLEQYEDVALYEKQPYFYIYIPHVILKYQILSCYAGRTGSAAYTYQFTGTEEFLSFAETIQGYAGYDTGTVVTEQDKIVTLSTCVNSNREYRYLVHGKLLEQIQQP